MTESHILEKVFRTVTVLKFETLFLSSDCLPIREIHAVFALLGKTLKILLFTATVNGRGRTSADILTSLGGNLSVPIAVLSSIFLRSL